MKKIIPQPFTASLTKVFRASFKRGKLAVNVKSGVIYAATDHLAVILTAEQYNNHVYPVTHRAPSDYFYRNGDEQDCKPLDIAALFSRIVSENANGGILEPCPLVLQDKGARRLVEFYHNPNGDGLESYDQEYTSVFSDCIFISAHKTAGALAIFEKSPVGFVLPINFNADSPRCAAHLRAVRAWFSDAPEVVESQEVKNLRAALNAAQQEQAQLEEDARRLRRQLQDEHAARVAAEQQAKPAANCSAKSNSSPAAAAQDLAKKFSALAGITATIKGAQTSIPIVWLSGDVEHNKAAIEKAGGKWSAKRSAYYIRCA